MDRTKPASAGAARAETLLTKLQTRFVGKLEAIAKSNRLPASFTPVEWLRDEGVHGGGVRYVAPVDSIFDRASVNYSQVHYDDCSEKPLGSATALSTIIHPAYPLAPSIHMHISWTEMKSGDGYWRIMADLNPAIPDKEDQKRFELCLQDIAGRYYEEGKIQGERYFFIPALNRHRGIAHFYLESFQTEDESADIALAKTLGERVIDCYAEILRVKLEDCQPPSAQEIQQQLAYHTLYFFQVLTLDRGTTSGLMVHDQNDIGIMGSLPSHVDPALLKSWQEKLPEPQDQLLEALLGCLSQDSPCPIDEVTKKKVADTVRTHYRRHPDAIKLQASGNTVPTTVDNHIKK